MTSVTPVSRKAAPQSPQPPTPVVPACSMRLTWDSDILDRDHFVSFTANESPNGPSVASFTSGISFGPDKKLVKSDMVQGLIAKYFVDTFEKQEPALKTLQSNFGQTAKYNTGNGQFDLMIDRPGDEPDLRYVGVIAAMPKSIADLFTAAREVREHF